MLIVRDVRQIRIKYIYNHNKTETDIAVYMGGGAGLYHCSSVAFFTFSLQILLPYKDGIYVPNT